MPDHKDDELIDILLDEIVKDCELSAEYHSNKVKQCKCLKYSFELPFHIFTWCSTSTLAINQSLGSTSSKLNLTALILSSFASICTVLVDYVKPAEKIAAHKQAHIEYTKLGLYIKRQIALGDITESQLNSFIDSFNEIETRSPVS